RYIASLGRCLYSCGSLDGSQTGQLLVECGTTTTICRARLPIPRSQSSPGDVPRALYVGHAASENELSSEDSQANAHAYESLPRRRAGHACECGGHTLWSKVD